MRSLIVPRGSLTCYINPEENHECCNKNSVLKRNSICHIRFYERIKKHGKAMIKRNKLQEKGKRAPH